jgi:4-carboxymuconolactone decarboxylase
MSEAIMPAPRLKPVEPPFTAEVAETLRRRMPKTGDIPPLALFRLLVTDDALAGAMEAMGRFNLRHEPGRYSSIEPRDREIVIDRVCARCECEYEWGVHIATYATKVGLTAEQVIATQSPDAGDAAWSERDRLLVRMVDALHDHSDIDDSLWTQLSAVWSDVQLLQLLVLAGWYHAISYVANVSRIPQESWAANFTASSANR